MVHSPIYERRSISPYIYPSKLFQGHIENRRYSMLGNGQLAQMDHKDKLGGEKGQHGQTVNATERTTWTNGQHHRFSFDSWHSTNTQFPPNLVQRLYWVFNVGTGNGFLFLFAENRGLGFLIIWDQRKSQPQMVTYKTKLCYLIFSINSNDWFIWQLT